MAVLTRKPLQVRNLSSCVKGFFKVALPLIAALLVFTYMITRTKYSVTPPTMKYLAHTAYHRDHEQTTDEHARSREYNQTTATETRAVPQSSKKTAKCMNIIEHDEMKDMCKMYKHGMITGDMCSPLCEQGLIQITECATAKHLQKQVMVVTCTDACVKGHTVPAILKSELRAAMKKFTYLTNSPNSTHDDVHHASRDHVTQYTKTFMGFDPFEGKDAFKVVWGQGSAHDLVKEQYAGAVWRSLLQLVSLTRPSEYMLLKTFADKAIFPQIYGSCGHFYVEESCPSRPQDWIPPELAHLNPSRASWIGRVQDALKTLDVLQRLETNFTDQFIHCDIKYTNFGVCGDGTVRIIDSNSMVFQSMTPGTRRKACQETGATCNVIGRRCEGVCDALLGTCVMKHNPNLEFACRALFMDKTSLTGTLVPGDGSGRLLRDPPHAVSAELGRVLHDCQALSHLSRHEPGANQRVLQELRTILTHSLVHTEY